MSGKLQGLPASHLAGALWVFTLVIGGGCHSRQVSPGYSGNYFDTISAYGTPLHRAMRAENELNFRADAKPPLLDDPGRIDVTPLEMACGSPIGKHHSSHYFPKYVKILLEAGADARKRPGHPSPLELVRARSPRSAEDEALIAALVAHRGEETRP